MHIGKYFIGLKKKPYFMCPINNTMNRSEQIIYFNKNLIICLFINYD